MFERKNVAWIELFGIFFHSLIRIVIFFITFAVRKLFKNSIIMYAIVEIAGLQYKVEQDQQLYVNRLQGDAGAEVSFDRVLLTDNGTVQVGAPVIDGVTVVAKIVEHVKGDKVIVFKKKRRKGYKKKNGHRQALTQIVIEGINI